MVLGSGSDGRAYYGFLKYFTDLLALGQYRAAGARVYAVGLLVFFPPPTTTDRLGHPARRLGIQW